MVKKLRNKFVLVTTTLMVVVLGSLLIINTSYNNYWNDIEIVDMLEWISNSGIFTMQKDTAVNEDLVEDMTEEDKPIIGMILDQNKMILKKQVIGRGKNVPIPKEIIEKMCVYKQEESKIGKYYYVYSELDAGKVLLVIMDATVNEHLIVKILCSVGLITCGISVLILITLFLSRFVTEPAEQSLLREKRFISDASHELKTPLGAISINAQALQLTDKNNLYINNIISESERMNRLIERLLTLSKLDEVEEVEKQEINLSDICEEMALTYESVAFENDVDFQYELEPDICMRGNGDEIRQLLAILIDNAIKNAEKHGHVSLQCHFVKKQREIIVKNTGNFIDAEDLSHVFDRFYTSDTSRKSNSFGLGLAIAKSIVERHNGTIDVKSIAGKETIFTVFI